MRKNNLIGILVVVLFLLPLINTSSDYSPTTADSNPYLPQITDTSPFAVSSDRSTGVGPALPVTISGQVSNAGQGTISFDSSSSGIGSVTLTDGWTASELQAEIDSLTWTAEDILQNGDLNDYHLEQFIVTPVTTDNDDAVQVPDDWTLVKDSPSETYQHPQHGVYELDSDPNGYGSTRGVYLEAQWSGSFNHNPNEEIYISQMITTPWREVYSAQLTFRYRVSSSSNMNDQVHLFVRLGGDVTKFNVFESGDTTDTWLTGTVNIPASSMTGLSTHALLFDIGLASDLTGLNGLENSYAYIDDIELDFTVRPFPEQVDLKANGTLVWGSTTHSVYPYVPDDDNRDCYDATSGIDLDGYGNDGGLGVGIYSSGFLMDTQFQVGLQFPLDIPVGAIVTSAYLEVEARVGSSPYLEGMRLYVADATNSSSFTSGAPNLEDRYSWLDTYVPWSVNSWIDSVDIRYRSPEIGSLIQAVTGNSTWTEGNYITVMLDHMYSDYYQRWNDIKGTSHYDGDNRARLFVEYLIPEVEDTILFFDYQKDITVDHNDVAGDLQDFPVLIDITDSDLKDNVLSNGNDIAFTIGGSSVDHEIELYDYDYSPTEARLVAWVKVPTLSSSVDTVITMHYGSPNAPPALGERVWDEYATVQHLNRDPVGFQYDSTSNNYDGTPYGDINASALRDGQIGNALHFDGIDDFISIGQITTDDWTQFTMSIWLYQNYTDDNRAFSKSLTTTPTDHIITMRIAGNYVTTRIQTDGGGGGSYDGNTTVSLGAWHYVTWSWSASRGSVIAYLDGDPVTDVAHGGTSIYDSDAMFVIGNTDHNNDRFWNGLLDEARLTTMVRSEAWIDTEYTNQDDPAGFYTVGSQETTPSTWTDAGDTEIVFTTSSPSLVSMDVTITMDVGGVAQSMDTDFNEGVNYFIETGSNIVNWTTKVMVSPPAGATSLGFSVEYPRAEWKATQVLNPLNQPKTVDQDWWYNGGTLTLNATAIDFWGVWTLHFISWNFIDDLQINSAAFNVSDTAHFTMTTPTVIGARVGLDLVQPDGSTWYSAYNETTGADPDHKFPSFRYRKDITIPSAEIRGSVDNFPVLLQFEDTDLYVTSKVRSDASDILFASGNIILDHEIEYFKQDYSINTAYLTAWVKTNLTNGVDNTITMYYGAEVVDNLENTAGVWSNGYEGVWHLGEEDLVIGGETHFDSSGNGYDGTRYQNVEVFDGAGYSQAFDGNNDYISIDETLTPENDVLITGWFKLDSGHTATSPSTQVILEKYIDIDHDMVIALVGQDYGQGTVPNGSLVLKVESSPNSAVYKWTQLTTWTPGVWYFIACYADEDDPSNNAIWVNMNWNTDAGQVGSSSQANMSYVEEWRLGGGDYDSGIEGSGYFDGRLDEFRISNTIRSDDWLENERMTYFNDGSFTVPGTEQERTSPEHTLSTSLSTAPAGQWTAIAYYNDTGTSVTDKAGLYERTFIVRHDTDLTLTKPTDAIGDRLSVKTAGDALFVEYELTDSDVGGNPGVSGATITMNWTSPTTITLTDYGSGLYGTVLDTTDLGDNKQWRIEVQSYHQYYNNATEFFNVDLYHSTQLDADGVTTTPADFNFTATLTFTDEYTGAPISGADITYSTGIPVQFVTDNGDGTYDIAIPTGALALGDHLRTIKATHPSDLLHVSQVDITFTLRAHYTVVSVSGDMETPYGADTSVSISLFDLDTGLAVDITDVGTITFSYTGGYDDDTYGSFGPLDLTTANWLVGTETATLTITMSNSDLLAPGPYVFSIEILAHKTSLTVTGVTTEPYGNQTSLMIILTDLEDGSPVPIGSVSNIRLQYTHAPTFTDFSSYGITLDTSSWGVGTWTVTVVVTMTGTIYNAPTNYLFDITIQSLTTVMYHGPSTLNFTIGSDFTLDLHLNVSEVGPYYGDPITDRLAVEFTVPGYTRSIDTSQQANGVYSLTISNTYFTGGVYEIVVYFNSASNQYADTFLVIQFTYREIVSYLTSPNYPQVTTPYQLDVEIILEYADADFGTGIEGATIDSPDHQAWIINTTDETGGVYNVWIDVSSLAQGTHYITLRADKSGYDARTIEIRIEIREAFTSATPSVGSLSIPIGNSPVFYVNFIDIDRLEPIDNLTSPYTQVVSDWGDFSVEYLSGTQEYMITFHTSDTLVLNQPYTFTFSKSNYKNAQFTITVTIRTHNTDFRIVSSIDPTTTIGTFNISVYYGDLDNTIGIDSASVDFSVENASGIVTSIALNLGGGYYILQVPASQFGLGLQTFTVYADWTGAVETYQDKSFITTANVLGRDSALTLIIGSEPTPYNEDMSYTFFFSDTGVGISNLTGNVFVYVSFQGEAVNPSDITIIDFTGSQDGNYSIQFNNGIFSRTGLIYMNVFVNWSRGVAPFYSNRTDVISVRVLPRDTLLTITPPSAISYNENATLVLTFEDVTGGSSSLITGLTKQEISLNISFSFVEAAGVYTISFNTNQFGSIDIHSILIGVTWAGSPFYANRTGQITYINVLERQTYLEYLTPSPTQYGDQVIFNVTWTDTTGGSSNPITSANLVLKDGIISIDPTEYAVFEISPGVYQVTLNTTYATNPGTRTLRVEMSAGVFYISDVSIGRFFEIQMRKTLVAADPVADVPFGSTIIFTLSYLDLFTGDAIANDSQNSYAVTLEFTSPSGLIFTSSWSATTQKYQVEIEWDPAWDAVWPPVGFHAFSVRMIFANQAPFYEENTVQVTFQTRIRDSTLSLITEPETTPYLETVTFAVFYGDDDASGGGISSAQIVVLNNSIPLIENTHYTLTEGSAGYYTVVVDSTALGGLGLHILEIQASWTGAPYHGAATRDVNILVRQRETNLEVTIPPAQTLYLDNVTFTFLFNDIDASSSITIADLSIIHIYLPGMIEINPGDYSLNQIGSLIEVTISSSVLSPTKVIGLSLNVTIDWDYSLAPFYKDDSTIVKITITGRSILVETGQIERTPKGDILNISITLTDLDNGDPVVGAIIQFSCQFHSLVEGVDYTRFEGAGIYTFNVDTLSLSGTGTFLFYITVQWDPGLSPFYSNRTTSTLTGLVDLVRTSLTVDALIPSTVQFTGDVSLRVTWHDLDHDLPVSGSGYATVLQSNIHYLITGLSPAGLVVFETGTPGVYNISFTTNDLASIGSYTLEIVAAVSVYAPSTVTPQFSVVEINTDLTPLVTSQLYNWTDMAYIYVDYTNLLDDVLISGATVSWSIEGVVGGYLDEPGVPGHYRATINTDQNNFTGTQVISITATLDKYTTATTTATLNILPLPSDIVIIDPPTGVLDVSRGNPVPISVRLSDILRAMWINNLQVETIYATFQGIQYPLSWDSFSSSWVGAIPGGATVLDPSSYDVRLTAGFWDYQSAGDQFRINIRQTQTDLSVHDPETGEELIDIDAVFSQVIYFALNLTERVNSSTVESATVYWYESAFNGLNLTFVYNDTLNLWVLEFNTSLGFYGTWGLTFRAFPDDPILAPSTTTLTLTIKKITTEVIGPTFNTIVDWGWTGNISFFYNDTAFDRGITNATVLYDYGTFRGLEAYDLGNGTYLLFINTTYLESNAEFRIIVDLQKANFEERTSGTTIIVGLRNTELLVSVDDTRTWASSGDQKILEVPMGDILNITFLFNDTSLIGGLFGGLGYAEIDASLSAFDYFPQTKNITLLIENLGSGWYSFVFDTNNLTYYETNMFVKIIRDGSFFLTLRMDSDHRIGREVVVSIKIIKIETEIQYTGNTSFDLLHLDEIEITLVYFDTWHNSRVENGQILYSGGTSARVVMDSNITLQDGLYQVTIRVTGTAGENYITLTLVSEFYQEVEMEIRIGASPNDGDILISQLTTYGLPISLFIILILGAYVRVWSVPKRIRQINGQLKTLRKGKVPKPIKDVKSRQQLTAELFNDTFAEMKITRTAAQMPEDAIPIEVPEMGELLMQLAILTNLSPEELDEFQADIAKMKISEQAAFVKEVIMQEAIRAARRDGRTIDETIAAVEYQAKKRLGGEEEAVEPVDVVDTGPVETVFLEEKKKGKVTPDEKVTAVDKETFEEVTDTTSEKMSMYELEELRKDLERRGVPPHEIETIIEQAKELSRELVDELVKSLGGKKD